MKQKRTYSAWTRDGPGVSKGRSHNFKQTKEMKL